MHLLQECVNMLNSLFNDGKGFDARKKSDFL